MAPAESRILVTGAEGFVGRWLLRTLVSVLPSGATIAGCARAGCEAHAPPGVKSFVLDVTDRVSVRDAVRSFRPTGIFHLAAIASIGVARNDAHLAWDVNLGGTMNVAEALMSEAPDTRLVFAGTSDAYGGTFARIPRPVDEDAALDPTNVYAASKAAADLMLGQMAREGLQVVRMRPFNHTGPGQAEAYVIPAFAAQIARIDQGRQEPVLRVGNLEAARDFLDVRDVVAGYVAALLAPRIEAGTILNLASGIPRRIGDVLDALLRASVTQIRIEQDPARMRPSEVPVAVGSSRRAEALLGWRPAIPFEQTLADVLDHFRAAPT